MAYLGTFAFCLFATIAIEVAFSLFVGIRGWRNLMIVGLVQVMTNPAVVLAMMFCRERLYDWPVYAYELPLEAMVVFAEGCVYWKFLREGKRPFSFSLMANYISYSMGFILSGYGFYW